MKLAQYSDRAKAVGVICHKYLERNSRYQQLMANMRDIPNSASAQKPEETTAAAAAATAAAANAAKDAQAAATDFQKQVDTLKSGMSSNQGSESPAEETAEAQTARVPDASASQSTAQEKPSSTSRGCHNTVECAKAMLNDARTEDLPAAMSAADAIDSFPRAPRGDRVSARRLNQQGLSALHAGHAEDAVNLLTQAVQADRGDQEIAANLAYAYAANGEFAKSEDTAVQALALNPRRTSVWAPLAETLAKEHRPDQAIEAMWLAYQFSSDKQKTFSFIDSKVATEKDPDALKMYAASKSWFEKNEKPSVLR
jgi:tetratricopeptide (TPR) repeat protein